MLKFTAGEDHALDNRLVRYDIIASIAHAQMLGEMGLLSAADLAAIQGALTAIGEEHAQGRWRIELEQEDCQTAIENLLTERIGEAGGRLHAGRSRNDQVLAALRLYLRDAAEALRRGAISGGGCARCPRARHADLALPGYTHMQQAMPSSVALWASGFAAELRDDAEGLALQLNGASARIHWGPRPDMGRRIWMSAANRPGGAWDFAVIQEPVTAVQLSRGKAEAQLLFEITLLTQDLSKLAADLLLFYTQEFGYVSLPEAFTTGSSIMPQKRNPDVFELIRGRSAVAQAALNEVLGVTQKLTSGYHRDLQLIKPPLFRGIDSCLDTWRFCRARSRVCAFGRRISGSIRRFTPPPRPMLWSRKKAFRFAKPTGASPRN